MKIQKKNEIKKDFELVPKLIWNMFRKCRSNFVYEEKYGKKLFFEYILWKFSK